MAPRWAWSGSGKLLPGLSFKIGLHGREARGLKNVLCVSVMAARRRRTMTASGDLPQQAEQGVECCQRVWRAAGDVEVHRDDGVGPVHDLWVIDVGPA